MAKTQSATTELVEEAKPRKTNFKKLVIYVTGAIAALVVLIVLFVNTATAQAVKVSNQFIDDIQSQNATAAYALFSDEAKSVVEPNQFDQLVARIGPILNSQEKLTDKEISKETGADATAKITYEVEATDNKTYQLVVNLTKAGDDWWVVNFDSQVK